MSLSRLLHRPLIFQVPGPGEGYGVGASRVAYGVVVHGAAAGHGAGEVPPHPPWGGWECRILADVVLADLETLLSTQVSVSITLMCGSIQ